MKQQVFSRPKHKVFSLAHRSQVVFTRLLCTTGFVKNRTTNASIRRTNLSIRPAKRLTRGFLQQDETRGFLQAQTQGVFASCSIASGFHEVTVRLRTYASPCRAMLVLISAQTQGVFGKLKHKGFSPGPNTRCFRSLIDHKWFSRGYCARWGS